MVQFAHSQLTADKNPKKIKKFIVQSFEFIMDENGRNCSFMILLENANIYFISCKLRCDLSFWSLVESIKSSNTSFVVINWS